MPDDFNGEDKQGLIALLILGGAAAALGLLALKGTEPPPGSKRSPCPPLGDVDGDGFISLNDANLILSAVAGITVLSPEQLRRADVNRDCQVTAIDATAILRLLAGLPVGDDMIAGFHCKTPVCQVITVVPRGS